MHANIIKATVNAQEPQNRIISIAGIKVDGEPWGILVCWEEEITCTF